MSVEHVQSVNFARAAGHVRRLHVAQVLNGYDIAQHTFNALILLRVMFPEASPTLIWAVLVHDLPEVLTGDIPSPAKKLGAWFNADEYENVETEILNRNGFHHSKLTNEEAQWLRIVDMLELYLFCRDQRQLGNTTLRLVEERITKYIESDMSDWPQVAKDFWLHIELYNGGIL